MATRHDMIGIKQAIRLEWMQKTANLLKAGLNQKAIRSELHGYLAEKMGDGTTGDRGSTSRTQVVNMLMNIWVTPDPELVALRDALLEKLPHQSAQSLPVHWAMVSAAYPFWFNVARQVGRILSLQDQVTQAQIFNRLKEQYGDRETVSRYARYTVRSFVFWGVLQDTMAKGCYQIVSQQSVVDPQLASLLIEGGLHANAEGKGALALLMNSPCLFPFSLPSLNGDTLCRLNPRMEVSRYGLDDELLKIKQPLF